MQAEGEKMEEGKEGEGEEDDDLRCQ